MVALAGRVQRDCREKRKLSLVPGEDAEHSGPGSTIYVITNKRSSHSSKNARACLKDHPRALIPKVPAGCICSRGLVADLRHQALGGHDFAHPGQLAPISTQAIRPHPLPRNMPLAGGFAQVDGLGRC